MNCASKKIPPFRTPSVCSTRCVLMTHSRKTLESFEANFCLWETSSRIGKNFPFLSWLINKNSLNLARATCPIECPPVPHAHTHTHTLLSSLGDGRQRLSSSPSGNPLCVSVCVLSYCFGAPSCFWDQPLPAGRSSTARKKTKTPLPRKTPLTSGSSRRPPQGVSQQPHQLSTSQAETHSENQSLVRNHQKNTAYLCTSGGSCDFRSLSALQRRKLEFWLFPVMSPRSKTKAKAKGGGGGFVGGECEGGAQ